MERIRKVFLSYEERNGKKFQFQNVNFSYFIHKYFEIETFLPFCFPYDGKKILFSNFQKYPTRIVSDFTMILSAARRSFKNNHVYFSLSEMTAVLTQSVLWQFFLCFLCPEGRSFDPLWLGKWTQIGTALWYIFSSFCLV